MGRLSLMLEIVPVLTDWLFSAELLEMDEFRVCLKAYRNQFDELLNSIEGYNTTKTLKRVCFGM